MVASCERGVWGVSSFAPTLERLWHKRTLQHLRNIGDATQKDDFGKSSCHSLSESTAEALSRGYESAL